MEMVRLKVDLLRKGEYPMGMGKKNEDLPIRQTHVNKGLVSFTTAFLRYNSHTIEFTHLKCTA